MTRAQLELNSHDVSRLQREGLIVNGLRELRRIESGLDRQFNRLKCEPPKARAPFLDRVLDLEERARCLEHLIDTLEECDKRLPA